MDFNDLSSRLERIYTSLNERYDYNIDTNIKSEIITNGRYSKIHTHFGNKNFAELSNTIFGAIGAIADLKDHLVNKTSKKSVEDMINMSIELSLILDLNNKDKHGDPLTRTNRSGKNPNLANLCQGLSPAGRSKTFFTMTYDGQNINPGPRAGEFRIVTSADVVDQEGNVIMTLDKMLYGGIAEIEKFLSQHNLIV